MNWSTYNQSQVKRGEILLGFDLINNWDNELEVANQGRIGQPFYYQILFFFYLVMPRHTFIYHIGKPKE